MVAKEEGRVGCRGCARLHRSIFHFSFANQPESERDKKNYLTVLALVFLEYNHCIPHNYHSFLATAHSSITFLPRLFFPFEPSVLRNAFSFSNSFLLLVLFFSFFCSCFSNLTLYRSVAFAMDNDALPGAFSENGEKHRSVH